MGSVFVYHHKKSQNVGTSKQNSLSPGIYLYGVVQKVRKILICTHDGILLNTTIYLPCSCSIFMSINIQYVVLLLTTINSHSGSTYFGIELQIERKYPWAPKHKSPHDDSLHTRTYVLRKAYILDIHCAIIIYIYLVSVATYLIRATPIKTNAIVQVRVGQITNNIVRDRRNLSSKSVRSGMHTAHVCKSI